MEYICLLAKIKRVYSMQQAVFLFTQIFFVVLVITVFGIVIFAVIKNRDKNVSSIDDKHIAKKADNK